MKVVTCALAVLALTGLAAAQQHLPAEGIRIAHAGGGGAPGPGTQIQIEYVAAEFGGGVFGGNRYGDDSDAAGRKSHYPEEHGCSLP